MKFCKLCVLPDTRPNLHIDSDGVCNACKNHANNINIDWSKRKKEFSKLINSFKKNNNYDCIIPVSGGKDSTFQTYVIKKVYGLNPLVVNFHPLDQTEIGKKNLQSLIISIILTLQE